MAVYHATRTATNVTSSFGGVSPCQRCAVSISAAITPFAFAAPYFQAICSDLGPVRIADAVASSMSVPLAFRPVVVGTYADKCPTPLPAWVAQAAKDHAAPVLLRETEEPGKIKVSWGATTDVKYYQGRVVGVSNTWFTAPFQRKERSMCSAICAKRGPSS